MYDNDRWQPRRDTTWDIPSLLSSRTVSTKTNIQPVTQQLKLWPLHRLTHIYHCPFKFFPNSLPYESFPRPILSITRSKTHQEVISQFTSPVSCLFPEIEISIGFPELGDKVEKAQIHKMFRNFLCAYGSSLGGVCARRPVVVYYAFFLPLRNSTNSSVYKEAESAIVRAETLQPVKGDQLTYPDIKLGLACEIPPSVAFHWSYSCDRRATRRVDQAGIGLYSIHDPDSIR